jgi:D-glycero-D-manno-heptose 1,7-bisphosphate phosphatase
MPVVTTDVTRPKTNDDRIGSVAVFLDLDTVLLSSHPGKYGPELAVQADLADALDRLAEADARVIVVANPPPEDGGHVMDTDHRLEVLRSSLGGSMDDLVVVSCPHGEDGACDCAKPGNGLIQSGLKEQGLERHAGWYVGGDQEGVVAGRTAGLHTIRIGPAGEDHLSAVHRADYVARDLLDAANRILLEALAGD